MQEIYAIINKLLPLTFDLQLKQTCSEETMCNLIKTTKIGLTVN